MKTRTLFEKLPGAACGPSRATMLRLHAVAAPLWGGLTQALGRMETITDPVLGQLSFDYTWHRAFRLRFFGKALTTLLRVEADEGEVITDVCRAAYRELIENLEHIVSQVEASVEQYCLDAFPESPVPSVAVGQLVSLHHVCILLSRNSAKRMIGFVIDSPLDEEQGIGVLVVNGLVSEVSVQDSVL